MSREPAESADHVDPDDGPVERVAEDPREAPGFLQRLLEHVDREEPDDDFEFEGIEVGSSTGVYITALAVYIAEDDTPSTPEQIAAGASPTGPLGFVMRDWAEAARAAIREEWGEPTVHTPRLVGSEQEPEGMLDYLMVTQDFTEAEVWDRGPRFVAIITVWSGEPGQSMLRQFVVLLPREYMMGGMFALLDDEEMTAYPKLMSGEHPLELRRRAWILSTAFGSGEEHVSGAPVAAARYGLRANGGTAMVWIFADDGRQLLLVVDPESRGVPEAAEHYLADHGADGFPDARLLLINRLLDGIPTDLLACIPTEADAGQGEGSRNVLEFGVLDGVQVPLISGAFWFDGEMWRATRGLLAAGATNGMGIDDFGLGRAVRTPFFLGSDFTPEVYAAQDAEYQQRMAALFAACPYPAQARPEGMIRLGYGMPEVEARDGMADEIEALTAAWWSADPDDTAFDDDTFRVAGRTLRAASSTGLISARIGVSENATRDVLAAWVAPLVEQWSERWGQPLRATAVNRNGGAERRSELGRLQRGSGLREAPLWWVNGHAVVLLSGTPDPEWGDKPEVTLAIVQADAVLELLGGQYLYDVRMRTRQISNAAEIAGADRADRSALQAHQLIDWAGPPLAGSDIVPFATRGGLRTGNMFWAWHFTHDGRGLLTSHAIGDQSGTLSEMISLFKGVPEDLLTLVIDRPSDGLYPVVAGEPELRAATARERAQRMPNAKAVFFHDGHDWRASRGTLRLAHTVSVAEAIARAGVEGDADADAGLTANPLSVLYSESVGVPQLRWALRAEEPFTPAVLASPGYGDFSFARRLTPEEAERAFDQVLSPHEAALTTTLDRLLDTIAHRVGHRNLLDAALSNTDAQHRRENALWLLGAGADPQIQLSGLTPLALLVENPLLSHRDDVLVRALLNAGADPGFGLLGPVGGRHPLIRLCERPLVEARILPLIDALLDDGDGEPRYDVLAWVTPDGRSLLDHARDSRRLHERGREQVIERLEAYAAKRG